MVDHSSRCRWDSSDGIESIRNTSTRWVELLALAVFLTATGAVAADAPQSPPAAAPRPVKKKGAAPASPAAQPATPMLEPKAVDVLKAASSRLAAARTLSFTAVISYESPSRPGPALVYTTRSEVTLQRPDKLQVITPGDGPASEFYYDGKVMVAFAPAESVVAVADAPASVDEALKVAYDSAAIYFPFSDLIVADPYKDIADGLKLAFYIGQSHNVGGTTTDMVAYANDAVFVQAWIGAEDKLPRAVRAVYRDDPSQLRHHMELSNWQVDGPVPANAFTWAHTNNATKIEFARPDPVIPPGVAPPTKGKQPKTK